MRWLIPAVAVAAFAACGGTSSGGTSGGGTSGSGGTTTGGSTGGGTSTGGTPQLDICTSENGALLCLLQDPNLTISFPPGPVGSPTVQVRLDVVNRSSVPLQITSITLDPDALAAGYSIVETNLYLPKTISAATGLAVPFHVALTPAYVCPSDGCLTGRVSVGSNDPYYAGRDPPGVGLIGTGN